MKGFMKALPLTQEATEEINASYSKSVMDIMVLYYYAGKWDPTNEAAVKEALENPKELLMDNDIKKALEL